MKRIVLILIVIIISISCSDTLVDTPPQINDFSLNITVKDNSGNTVPNLMVSAWNKLPVDNYFLTKVGSTKSVLSGSTSIQFSLNESNLVRLNIFDLEETLFDTLINRVLAPGSYIYSWQNSKPNRVYKVLFEVIADSLIDSLNYRDSIYIVNHSIEPHISILGETDAEGKFETKNKLYFSSLYNLPEFNWTVSNGPEIVKTFSLLDTIVIALSDTVNKKVQYYNHFLENGKNEVALNWDYRLLKKSELNEKSKKLSTIDLFSSIDSIPIVGIPKKNELFQNYPNPYN